jgi:polyribonucleotide nucleotidyltransferase
MLEKLMLPVLLLFNSIGNSIDPTLINDGKAIEKIQKEISVLNRKKELIEITEDDFTALTARTKKVSKEITSLEGKILKIEKIDKLKQKWAKEDSLEKTKSVKAL